MSNNEANSSLEDVSTVLHAATKLSHNAENSGEITLEMLASAFKLAALSTDEEGMLTSAAINTAIQTAKQASTQREEESKTLTTESLAIALKLATKIASTDNSDETHAKQLSLNQMKAAMKAAIALTSTNSPNGLVTEDLLTDARKLAKN